MKLRIPVKQLVWFLDYLWRDIAKDFGGPQADIGQTAAQKRQYNLWVCYLLSALSIVLLFVWWPAAIVFGLVLARKTWLLFTNTF